MSKQHLGKKGLALLLSLAMLMAWVPAFSLTANAAPVAGYHAGDLGKLQAFLAQKGPSGETNAKLLGWDSDAPDTWPKTNWADARTQGKNHTYINGVDWVEIDGQKRLLAFNVLNDQRYNSATRGYDETALNGALDFSGCSYLEFINGDRNFFTTVNVSGCTALLSLFCGYNLLTELYVPDDIALERLNCSGNRLNELDVSGHTSLKFLGCNNISLTELDVTMLTELEYLDCSSNRLTELDLSKQTALETLYCGDNRLTSLDVSHLTALKDLYCSENRFTKLDVSSLTALESLSCARNRLTKLDLTGLTVLKTLDCSGNRLDTLDVTGQTALERLDCSGNALTTLNVTGLTALGYLDCSRNQMNAQSDIAGLGATLSQSYNFKFAPQKRVFNEHDMGKVKAFLSQKDANGVTNADQLGLDIENPNNWATKVYWTESGGKFYLQSFWINNVNGEVSGTLDLSGCTKLESIYCNDNLLTGLDVTGCTALRRLEAHNNPLDKNSLDALKALEIQYITYTADGFNWCVYRDLTGDDKQTVTVKCIGDGYVGIGLDGDVYLYAYPYKGNMFVKWQDMNNLGTPAVSRGQYKAESKGTDMNITAVFTSTPTIKSISLNGTNVAVNSDKLTVTFDQAMKTDSVGSITLNNGAVLSNPTWNDEKTAVTYDLSGLDYSTDYSLTAKSFRSAYDIGMMPESRTFKTVDAAKSTPPAASASPKSPDTGDSGNQWILLLVMAASTGGIVLSKKRRKPVSVKAK